MRHSAYIPALDGLRAIAILLVFSLHFDIKEFPGGNIGVDIFFALSGFLITTLLQREYNATATISLKRFYLRRVLRLFPALLFLLSTYALVVMVFYDNWHDHFVAVLCALFYISNWVIAFNVGPFGLMALMHTWSLAVEEQFYLIWPPLFRLGLRKFKPTSLILLTILASAVSTIWRIRLYREGASVDRLYCGFDTRLDCLAVGCITAILLTEDLIRPRLSAILKNDAVMATILAIFIAVAAVFESTNGFMLAIGHTLVSILTCLLICGLLAANKSHVKTLLSSAPLVTIGKLSYAIYLWHHPVLIILRSKFHLTGWPLFVAAPALTGAVSVFSYYVVELRFLKLKERFTYSAASPGDIRKHGAPQTNLS